MSDSVSYDVIRQSLRLDTGGDCREVFYFGLRLRQLREKRGLSRKMLAKKLGVSKETIYRYENNVQNPSLDRTKQIAVILRTSVDYLIGLDNEYSIRISGLTEEQRDALDLFLQVFIK